MRKSLKTVDFILSTKILCSKLAPVYPLEYRQQIQNHMTLKIKVKVIIHL